MSSPTGPTGGPTADVSVRVAWADDAEGIAGVQVAAWREGYAGLLPAPELSELSAADFAAGWRASLTRPADARNRVLVALERNTIRGFVVLTPAADPDCDPVADGEVVELVVDPAHRGQGHGSRLQQAAVDTLVADRFARALTWVNADADRMRSFLTAAGWAADGAHRELALEGSLGEVRVKQVRLHTSIG